MQRYRLQNNEVLAMRWTPATHHEVVTWLDEHGFAHHEHDLNGNYPEDSKLPIDTMCVDAGDDMNIDHGDWLVYDEGTGELTSEVQGFDDAWKLVAE